jgi:RNA-directed DNA polymerase
MKKEMRELHVEGLATHDGPESCVDVCEGVGEALTGVRAGRAIEPRNQGDRGADAVVQAEGNIAGGVRRESLADPARSENLSMYGIFMREIREIPRLPLRVISGRAAWGTLRWYA